MKAFLRNIAVAALALAALAAGAGTEQEITLKDGWRAQPAEDVGVPPKEGLWLPRGILNCGPTNLPYKKPEKLFPIPLAKYQSVWCEKVVKIPGEWQGKTVLLEAPVIVGDAAVFVNGKRAGEILRPSGRLDLTAFLAFGSDNRILLFVTKEFKGISKKEDLYRAREEWFFGMKEVPLLRAVDAAFITDVFANTSARRGELALETEIQAGTPGKVFFQAEILDADGKTVKQVKQECSLRQGSNRIAPAIPWKDPHYWEIGAPYLYRCQAKLLDADGKELCAYPEFSFGFRDFRREGKELVMNGHRQALRTVYSFGANGAGAHFLTMIGYNTIHLSHSHDAFPVYDQKLIDYCDRNGIAIIAGAPQIGALRDKIRTDPAARAEYERYMDQNMRRYRNYPSILGWYVGVNTACPRWNMDPDKLGQVAGTGPQDQNINLACEIGKKYNPGTVFYSHADGSNGDMSSSNLYLNFTPIQEREEWLSQWRDKGVYPWHGAEFGEPYYACYWQKGCFIFTELMAIYYGDKAYDQEPLKGLEYAVPLSVANKKTIHGVHLPEVSLYKDFPLFWDFKRDVTWRTNRSWRTFGLNGGLIYFNLGEGYGDPPSATKDGCSRYRDLKEFYKERPSWANPGFDIYQLGNQDFLGYLGGSPLPTDKAHAFFAGAPVEKRAVFLWDGPGGKKVDAQWTATLADGEVVARGVCSQSLKTGDIRFDKIAFPAPAVKTKTAARIDLAYTSEGKELFKDSFPLEFYPAERPRPRVSSDVALYDPLNTAGDLFSALGVPVRKIAKLDDLGDAKWLVFAKNSLTDTVPALTERQIAGGLNVLILPQSPAVWQSLGFKVQDTMSRRLFLRDVGNPAFQTLTPDVLENWAGAPDYGKAFGSVMAHDTERGPRWTRNMTVAGLTLQIPEKVGFTPLIVGEFDMNFAALLRFAYGKGAITFCTLDFENRMGKDPAATTAAAAVLDDFLNRKEPPAEKALVASGDTGFLKLLGVTPRAFPGGAAPADSVYLVGKGSPLTWPDLARLKEQGATIVVQDNAALAKAAGFTVTPRRLLRTKASASPLLRGSGPSHFRWRDFLDADILAKPPEGFAVSADGLFAVNEAGEGKVVFAQVAPLQLESRYAADSDRNDAIALSTQRGLQLYALLLGNLGVKPDPLTARRLLHRKGADSFAPLKYFHVLGPFQASKDDVKAKLDTVFPGEDMAIAGDFNPNPRFKLPQGGETDWRPTITSDADGLVDLQKLFPGVSHAVTYSICEFERAKEGDAILKFGVDWYSEIWCDGNLVFRCDQGAHRYKFDIRLHLKKGVNYLTFKVGSGVSGNNFRAKLSTEARADATSQNDPELDNLSLYDERLLPGWDPYTFYFW